MRGIEVAGLAEFLVRAVSILRSSLFFFVTSVECMGRTKANPNTKLASGQTGNDREVAARLVSENLEGRGR